MKMNATDTLLPPGWYSARLLSAELIARTASGVPRFRFTFLLPGGCWAIGWANLNVAPHSKYKRWMSVLERCSECEVHVHPDERGFNRVLDIRAWQEGA